MAHRKPIGTTTGPMLFTWNGPIPFLDDYLVSEAGTWYRVAGILETTAVGKIKLVLERVAPRGAPLACVPDDEGFDRRVHEFYWHSRDRRAA